MNNESIKLPEMFCRRMQELLGEEAENFLDSYQKEREYGLRYNPFKFESKHIFEEKQMRELGWTLSPVPWCVEGYYYEPQVQPGRHLWHDAGAYYIQEPSAMSAVELLGAKPGENICDLCAAPGGKTTQIAGKMKGQGLLVSNEFYGNRAKILAQNVERMGIANTVVLNESTEHLAQVFPGFFDRILVDAPCSGEGMFRKDPEAVEQWSLENVELCAERQQEILNHAAEMLKPGGVLVYSTCTFAPEENEQCIRHFLEKHVEFSLETAEIGEQYFSPGQPEWIVSECSSIEEDVQREEIAKAYRLWPHKLRGEGHFAARLRKAGIKETENISEGYGEGSESIFGRYGKGVEHLCAGKVRKNRKGIKNKENVEIEAAVSAFQEFQEQAMRIDLEEKLSGRYVLFSEQLYLLPEEMPELKGLKVVRAGLHLGTCKKNRFEPSHALAMYLRQEEVRQCVMLSSETEPMPSESKTMQSGIVYGAALKYLHGETIACDSMQKGWTLVCVDGLSLGWGKAVNGVVKNHYPKGLRICY